MDCKTGEMATDLGCIPGDPAHFVQFVYNIGLGLIGIVSFLSLIYGSYVLITSQGRPDEVNKVKDYLKYSVIGLVFAALGVLFVKVIVAQILQVPGFE